MHTDQLMHSATSAVDLQNVLITSRHALYAIDYVTLSESHHVNTACTVNVLLPTKVYNKL